MPSLTRFQTHDGSATSWRTSPPDALAYLGRLGLAAADAGLLFHHTVAVLHATQYATDNADALRQNWPRVPLPATRDTLEDSAELGRRVAALLDSDAAVDGVTSGVAGDGFRCVADPQKLGGGSLADDDFLVNARWGVAGAGGATMPGPGRVTARLFTSDEAAALGPDAVARLGPDTLDVYLNGSTFWRNVPRKVWEYKLGGYQVLKKWLSYREHRLLGRAIDGGRGAARPRRGPPHRRAVADRPEVGPKLCRLGCERRGASPPYRRADDGRGIRRPKGATPGQFR